MEDRIFYDVVVVGGGTSGCSAAYNCAKLGLKTLLIEKNNFLGGLMTGGLVVPVMKSSTSDLNTDFYKKLIETAKKYDAQITYKDKNDGWLNPELLKIVLDDVLTSNDVVSFLDILFETTVEHVQVFANQIKKVFLKSLTLSVSIEANAFIDATGSGDFSIMCGCKKLPDTEEKQQNSLRFILGNVDIEKFCDFVKQIDIDEDITNTYRDEINTNNKLNFTTASTWDTNKVWALDKYLKKGVEEGILKEQDRSYFQIFSVAGSSNQVAFNCPRINNFNHNPYKNSLELIEARKAIYRLYNFVKSTFPGFENSEIVNIATVTGIREQNRIKGKYVFTTDDIIEQKTFDTPVLMANYSIDVHSDKKDGSILTKVAEYQLPIESLMSYDIDNLFIVGKIVSADFRAQSALRVQKSCMSMGEGIAKYISMLIN